MSNLEDNDNAIKKENPIANAFNNFLKRTEDIRDAAIVAAPAVGKWTIDAINKQKRHLDKYVQDTTSEGEIHAIAKGAHAASDLLKHAKEYERLSDSRAVSVLMKSLFIGIFSEYDVFIGDLLKAIYEKKPDLFKNIKREITLSELLEFSSVEAVKQDILDKEIDSFRRNSYAEQFSELESKFDIKTLRGFSDWSNFVELGQRRNLLTHNGGICSDQYINMCEKSGYIWKDKPNCGDDLMPTPKYFYDAIIIASKVAFMITHTLWRKLLPTEVEEADNEMNSTIFEIMSKERWKQGTEFSEFALTDPMVRKTSDINKRIRIINHSIGLNQLKREGEAISSLNSLDWSASIRDFQLAILVLKNDYKLAAELMKKIGKNGELITQLSYHNWPLFQDFRDRAEFHTAYQEIYDIPFIEEAAKEVQEIVNDESTSDQADATERTLISKPTKTRKKVSALKNTTLPTSASLNKTAPTKLSIVKKTQLRNK